MSYQARMGVSFTFFHPVRDQDGNYVAGQAAAVTKALLGPDRLAAPAELATLVLTDYLTGWVQAALTFTRLGTYTLSLTNPAAPVGDGHTVDYDVLVTPGIAPSETLLTSRDRVRIRMQLTNSAGQPIQPSDAHPFDSLIELVISEVSDEYQNNLGRTFIESAYTEYLDGSGTRSLVLGAGPMASFTSLSLVAYQSDGAGGVTEVLTAVPRSSYVLAGLRSQPRYFGRGRLDLIGCSSFSSVFTRGVKNYKAVYVAGLESVPEGVVGLATEDVVYRIMTRDTGHLLSQSLGDGSVSYMRPGQMIEARESRLMPFLLEAA